MVTLGSGIGVGVVLDNKIVRGATNTIEAGHMIVQVNGRSCMCGSKGCLEAYCSANSVVRIANEALKHDDKFVAESKLQKFKSDLSCKDIFTMVRRLFAKNEVVYKFYILTRDWLATKSFGKQFHPYQYLGE